MTNTKLTPFRKALILIDDMNLADDWVEGLDEAVCGEGLQGQQIRDAAIFMASNLWRSSEASCRCTPDPEKRNWLFRSWLRRTDLFLEGASNLYPEVCGVTVSDIERDQLHHQGCDPPPNSGGPWQLAHRNLSYVQSEAAEGAALISPETASGGPCLPSSKFSAPLLVSSTLEPGKRACAIFCAACPGSLRSTNAH
jgi:hypothetical protein